MPKAQFDEQGNVGSAKSEVRSAKGKANFDEQGDKFYSLLKEAGWSTDRIEALIWKRYKCSHWMACNESQRKGLMATAQSYKQKAKKADWKKKMSEQRQKIMGMVAVNGKDKEWLHELMIDWGFGDSLRKCTMKQLWWIKSALIRCFNPIKN
jgi:hypothetical protein